MSDELRRQLDALAERGQPRGADRILAAAQQGGRARAAWIPGAGIAAALALVVGVVTLTGGDGDDDGRRAGLALDKQTTTTREGDGDADVDAEAEAVEGSTTTTTSSVPPDGAIGPVIVPPAPKANAASPRLVAFGTCEGFLGTVKAQALEVVGPYGLGGSGGVRRLDSVASPTMSPGAEKSTASPAAPTATPVADSSSTNVQEAGVDEPDTVKTDGQTIFTITNGRLVAVSARGTPRSLGSLAVPGDELLLVGTKLLVLGNGSLRKPMPARPGFAPTIIDTSSSDVHVVDVSNPSAMKVESKVALEGGYLSARLVDGVARIVVQSSPVGLDWQYPRDNTPAAQEQATARNKEIVRGSTLANWSPNVTVTTAGGKTVRDGSLLSCGASYRPSALAGFGMLTLVTLDPKDVAKAQSTSVLADGNLVYGSTRRLYVATNNWGQLNPTTRSFAPSAQTHVHSFDITNRTSSRYVGSGSARGQFLNQFSFSEHDGRLRIATTDYATGGSESFVSVLEERAGALAQVGQVGGLGRNERIYAVRFLGDLGYVVTFRQVDPLYVLDLRDPTKPRITGELKIPGYSAYLHPIGNGLLVGIGQEVTEDGRRAGSQLSLFDVSDPANPKQVQRQQLGVAGSSSAVEFDHHAFLWWAPTNLAVVPVVQNDQNGASSVAAGLRVTTGAIAEVGRARHPSTQQPNGRTVTPQITRSVVVGDRLFTVSDAGILASALDTLADLTWVPHPG